MPKLMDYGPPGAPSYNELAWRLARLVEYCQIVNADEGNAFICATTAVNRMRKRGVLPLEAPIPPRGNEVLPLSLEVELSPLFPLILDCMEDSMHRTEILTIRFPGESLYQDNLRRLTTDRTLLRAIQLRLPPPKCCERCGDPLYRPLTAIHEKELCLKCQGHTRIGIGGNDADEGHNDKSQ